MSTERQEDSGYRTPARCETHVGEHDWQSVPVNVSAIGQALRWAGLGWARLG